jgi:hypothetical protein
MNYRDNLIAKIEAQRATLEPDAELVVSLEDFFTGNDDPGSIGCNLGDKQPSMLEFFETLQAIRSNAIVQDVLVRIYDYDDPEFWPYTDTVYILTSAQLEDVQSWVASLCCDEVHAEWMYGKPDAAPAPMKGMTPYSVWWN